MIPGPCILTIVFILTVIFEISSLIFTIGKFKLKRAYTDYALQRAFKTANVTNFSTFSPFVVVPAHAQSRAKQVGNLL